MLRSFGGEAHEIWNVADPTNPVLIARLGGLKDTHKNWWECDTGIAFLVSGAPDWRTNVPGKPLSDQEVTDVVTWLASRRVQNPGQPYFVSNYEQR